MLRFAYLKLFLKTLVICLTVFVAFNSSRAEAGSSKCSIILAKVFGAKKWTEGIASWFFRGPSEQWNDQRFYRDVKGEPYLALSQTDQAQWHRIEYFSSNGNPVIKINSRAPHIVPMQRRLENYSKHSGNEGRNMTRVTWWKPISMLYYRGYQPKHPLPQFQVFDGHHRFFFAWRQRADVYVEILHHADYYETNLAWDDLQRM